MNKIMILVSGLFFITIQVNAQNDLVKSKVPLPSQYYQHSIKDVAEYLTPELIRNNKVKKATIEGSSNIVHERPLYKKKEIEFDSLGHATHEYIKTSGSFLYTSGYYYDKDRITKIVIADERGRTRKETNFEYDKQGKKIKKIVNPDLYDKSNFDSLCYLDDELIYVLSQKVSYKHDTLTTISLYNASLLTKLNKYLYSIHHDVKLDTYSYVSDTLIIEHFRKKEATTTAANLRFEQVFSKQGKTIKTMTKDTITTIKFDNDDKIERYTEVIYNENDHPVQISSFKLIDNIISPEKHYELSYIYLDNGLIDKLYEKYNTKPNRKQNSFPTVTIKYEYNN